MELRKEIEPNIDKAMESYDEIVKIVEGYADFVYNYGDEEDKEFDQIIQKLSALTGKKDFSKYTIREYWEANGLEQESFAIALPDPIIVDNITREELREIVRRVTTFDIDLKYQKGNLDMQFLGCLRDFYNNFLKVNFKGYKHNYFHSHKDKDGKYFEYSIDEIVEKIRNNGKFR